MKQTFGTSLGQSIQKQQSHQANHDQSQTQKMMNQQQMRSLYMLELAQDALQDYLVEQMEGNPFIELADSPMESLENIYDLSREESSNLGELSLFDTLADRPIITIRDHLLHQILCYRDGDIRRLMIDLLDYLDDDGYIKLSPADLSNQLKVSQVLLSDALELLKNLDPAGIACQGLQEYWLLQIEQDSQAPDLAYLVVESYFEALTKREFSFIAESLQVDVTDINHLLTYYKRLSTSPMSLYRNQFEESKAYIIPDLTIYKEDGDFKTIYHGGQKGQISFNQSYYNRMLKESAHDQEVQDYLKNHKSEYQALIASLNKREETLLKVMEAIVTIQKNYFLSNGAHLQDMRLQDVAEICKIHSSTVSRAIKDKYIYTSFGMLRLASLFSKTAHQEGQENKQLSEVHQLIKQLIDQEDKQKPLSDQKLQIQLEKEGYQLSRRVVAKYREELGIASSQGRKQR